MQQRHSRATMHATRSPAQSHSTPRHTGTLSSNLRILHKDRDCHGMGTRHGFPCRFRALRAMHGTLFMSRQFANLRRGRGKTRSYTHNLFRNMLIQALHAVAWVTGWVPTPGPAGDERD